MHDFFRVQNCRRCREKVKGTINFTIYFSRETDDESCLKAFLLRMGLKLSKAFETDLVGKTVHDLSVRVASVHHPCLPTPYRTASLDAIPRAELTLRHTGLLQRGKTGRHFIKFHAATIRPYEVCTASNRKDSYPPKSLPESTLRPST